MSEFGAIKKRVRNSALNELEQARAELHNGRRSMNQRNAAIIDAWVRLYMHYDKRHKRVLQGAKEKKQ